MTTTNPPAQDVSDQLDLDITHALHRKGYPLIPVSTVRTVMRAARELQQPPLAARNYDFTGWGKHPLELFDNER